MDRSLASQLNSLSERQAYDSKLAFALEAGRIYGLRAQNYDMILKRQLNRAYRSPPVERMW
jgi:hypothetical protein